MLEALRILESQSDFRESAKKPSRDDTEKPKVKAGDVPYPIGLSGDHF